MPPPSPDAIEAALTPPLAGGRKAWAVSSAGEHYLDMVGAIGSIPIPPTIYYQLLNANPAPVFCRWAYIERSSDPYQSDLACPEGCSHLRLCGLTAGLARTFDLGNPGETGGGYPWAREF